MIGLKGTKDQSNCPLVLNWKFSSFIIPAPGYVSKLSADLINNLGNLLVIPMSSSTIYGKDSDGISQNKHNTELQGGSSRHKSHGVIKY